MTSQVLEQIVESKAGVSTASSRTGYNTLDAYTAGVSKAYSGPIDDIDVDPIDNGMGQTHGDPIGTHTEFERGNQGNIRRDLGNGLQERYDFSGHDNKDPHLNYDLSGASKKFTTNALEETHMIDLFDE